MRQIFICAAVCALLPGGAVYGAEKAAAAKPALTAVQCEQVKKDLKSQISALTRQFKACMQSGDCKKIDLNQGLGALAGQLKNCKKSGNCQEIKGKIAVLAKRLKTTDRNCAASMLKAGGASSRQGAGANARPEPPMASTAAVSASTSAVKASSETVKTSTTSSTSTGDPSSGSSSSRSSSFRIPAPVESEPMSGFQMAVNGVKDFFAELFGKNKKEPTDEPKIDKLNCWLPSGCETISAEYKPVKGDLFVGDKYDPGVIDPLDIKQGKIGDCYYLASVAAIAQQDPDAIKNMVRKNADGTYSVDFYRERKPWEFWKPKLVKETVTVDDKFPLAKDGPPFAKYGDTAADGSPELWGMVMEKAYAQYRGSYDTISNGGLAGPALEALTGKKSETYASDSVTIDQLIDWKKNKKAITASTPDMVPNLDVATNHVYYVMDVEKEHNMVTVGNPWGNEIISMSLDEFRKNFDDFTVNPIH